MSGRFSMPRRLLCFKQFQGLQKRSQRSGSAWVEDTSFEVCKPQKTFKRFFLVIGTLSKVFYAQKKIHGPSFHRRSVRERSIRLVNQIAQIKVKHSFTFSRVSFQFTNRISLSFLRVELGLYTRSRQFSPKKDQQRVSSPQSMQYKIYFPI